MTYEDAINAIKSSKPSGYTILCEALDIAVSALEMQIPKKPTDEIQIGASSDGKIYEGKCCVCREKLKQPKWKKQSFCSACGQALDWSDTK